MKSDLENLLELAEKLKGQDDAGDVCAELGRRLELAVEMVRDAIGVFDSLAFGVNTMKNLKKKLAIERDLLRERLEKIKEPPKQ